MVTGGGTGSGTAKSIVKSPLPAWTGALEVPRGRTLQVSGTGSQKYSSSVSPSSRGRSWCCQWKSSWSTSSGFQSRVVLVVVMRPACRRIRTGTVRYRWHA